ncbi:3-[(3aS,4S,7aS)-7a-methyl-1, 5-dioxo-octahydro-1H-inden-4-yl]propanoyl:CoA ligase [Mycobacterium avium subsp. paratuberculosis]|nr:3-[(3aS,4S,7aS)-7a-methyl-1, 5-dioxo-octahydro-1H-inden-4-yl]propanoyl:CoA ligase [Mycobacterium avium subsp. paratuberculosis]
MGLPAFRPVLHAGQHPLHRGRGRLRHRRLGCHGGVRRRVAARNRRPAALRQPGGAHRGRGQAARLARLRGGTRRRRRCPTGVGRIGDAVFVRHHRPAQGGPAATSPGRQRVLGAVGAGAGADPQVRHDAAQRLPVPRTALPRRRRELHDGRQPGRCRVDHHEEVRRRDGLAADRDAPGDARPVRADDVRAHAQASGSGAGPLRRVEPALRHPRRRTLPGRRQAPDDALVRPGHPRILRRHRGFRGHHHRPAGMARPPRFGRRPARTGAVLDEDGREVPVGQTGELYFEGGPDFEYFKDPVKTASVYNERGWRSLGDMGHLDEDGYLYLTDRSTFTIVSGGVNIYPQEVENLLVMHPKLLDAAVFGVPNDEFGEEVKAVVQPADGVPPGPDLAAELIAYCRAHLAGYKCPRTVEFDTLPRDPNGKLYKRRIRERYWQGRESRIV